MMNDVVQTLLMVVATAVFAGGVPIALSLYSRHLKDRMMEHHVASVRQATQQGAHLAYSMLAEQGGSIADPVKRNIAVAAGVKHVLNVEHRAVGALGRTAEELTAMVNSRLGGLLAADQGVSVATAPPPAPLRPVDAPRAVRTVVPPPGVPLVTPPER
jgi:hypothetical protein